MWLIKRKTADLLNFMENAPPFIPSPLSILPFIFFSPPLDVSGEFTNVYLSGPSSLLTQSLDQICC